jgi:hypothetical protein
MSLLMVRCCMTLSSRVTSRRISRFLSVCTASAKRDSKLASALGRCLAVPNPASIEGTPEWLGHQARRPPRLLARCRARLPPTRDDPTHCQDASEPVPDFHRGRCLSGIVLQVHDGPCPDVLPVPLEPECWTQQDHRPPRSHDNADLSYAPPNAGQWITVTRVERWQRKVHEGGTEFFERLRRIRRPWGVAGVRWDLLELKNDRRASESSGRSAPAITSVRQWWSPT